MLILGFSCYYHNSAAAIVSDGEVVAAVEEERLTRVKNDSRFPENAIRACLDWSGATLDDVDLVAFYEKPQRKLARILSTAVRNYPRGSDHFRAIFENRNERGLYGSAGLVGKLLAASPTAGARTAWDKRLVQVPHHLSHAASAFYPSPFESAAVLVADGVGEFATTTIGAGTTTAGNGKKIRLLRELRFPHSLGLLYSCFTHFLGFEVNDGEYKVMGLAPYGRPRFRESILDNVVHVRADGSFTIDESLLTYPIARHMYDRARMEALFGPRREPDEPLTQAHADLAASIQQVVEEIMLELANQAHASTGERNLVLAGGVALNCVANGRIQREGPFDDVWVQPAPGDSGGALGAALEAWHGHAAQPSRTARGHQADGMCAARLGPAYGLREVCSALRARDVSHLVVSPDEVAPTAAALLARGRLVGWFQGRMEFGPRALGSRSILADPRPAAVQKALNLKVKRRESFRPFAAAVLRDRVADWFALEGRETSVLGTPGDGYESPYMSLVARILPARSFDTEDDVRRFGGLDVQRNEISACTHVDGTSRIQTVRPQDDGRFHALITEFDKLTSIPLVLNTSFNRRGEPIVCTPQDAVDCFLDTDLDYLCMENVVAWKSPEAALTGRRPD
ncbi:carbamoyltransferase family protein [Amycolatopsis silviterrae]|uniref:Carbamoyltransferase n=1 Tax=Amycolatopsis silviterrae TaxID=1656914 RepID=A0ABW5HGH7_9PSEU